MEPTEETPEKHLVCIEVEALALTGDIVFRRSAAKGPLGLPFMKIVAQVTKSEFTHAALLFWQSGELYVFEVTDIGTMKYRLIDWLDFCLGGRFEIHRVLGLSQNIRNALDREIRAILFADPQYDYRFNNPNRFYCTESVATVYGNLGIRLMEPRTIRDTAGRFTDLLFRAGNWIYSKLNSKASLDIDQKFYFVGNLTNGGLMASKRLSRVYSR